MGDGVWAASGAMSLTGRPDGPPLHAPRRTVARLAQLGRSIGERVGIDVPALLGERAAIAGFTRGGTTSCGGATRLIRTADGWCAVCLARPDDIVAIEAWIGVAADPDDPWPRVERALAELPAHAAAERAQALAMPVTALAGGPTLRDPVERTALGDASPLPICDAVVVDLSSLWAGPLCGHLLQLAGARVIKVESTRRPDGARSGPPAFFDLLHAGQESVALDLGDPDGVRALEALLRRADVVIEGSRPRALEQLGIDIRSIAAGGRLRAWVSLTACGRAEPWRERVGFGDDAAVGAGLVAWDDRGPVFCADAIADPLAGLTAAGAAFDVLAMGGSWLLDVSLHGAAGAAVGPDGEWAPGDDATATPRARAVTGVAAPSGRDTATVLRELVGARP